MFQADYRTVEFGNYAGDVQTVLLDRRPVGHIKPCKTERGYMLHITGKVWDTGSYTHCKSLKAVMERVKTAIPDMAKSNVVSRLPVEQGMGRDRDRDEERGRQKAGRR
jgi:hypothetical protein